VRNDFDRREAYSLERFAQACSEIVKQLTDDELHEIIGSCNAETVIVPNQTCCFLNPTPKVNTVTVDSK
jgi:hypothetical protein